MRDTSIMIVMFAIWLSMVCGIGYVALHFVMKFW